jgi:hypothetical protein
VNEGAATVSRITTPFLPSKPWFFVAGLALVLLAGAVLLWATFGWSWFLATLLLYGIIFSWSSPDPHAAADRRPFCLASVSRGLLLMLWTAPHPASECHDVAI